MSRPGSPSSFHSADSGIGKHILRPPPLRSNSHESKPAYRLFPPTVEPTPPATPNPHRSSQQQKTPAPPRTRSTSFDSTARIAAEKDAKVKTVPRARGRKISMSQQEMKHMSTVQELPSPTISIPYSFMPRTSEDTLHARSSSAPGEYLRESQALPSLRIDLSKPQWTSKQADTHPAKGLGLSFTSMSTDRLPMQREPPMPKARPALTIEIKQDRRPKQKAIIVRDDILEDTPPPPPPKSPRHDSRNQSLSGIQYDGRTSSRARTGAGSRASSRMSNNSPESANPTSEAMVAPQGNFVKAALVDTPSPSSPHPPKSVMPHMRQESWSPLSGDVRIKELMASKTGELDDLDDRPIPPPITPGQPRVASMARIMSVPALPKAIEKTLPKHGSERSVAKIETTQIVARPQESAKSAEPVITSVREVAVVLQPSNTTTAKSHERRESSLKDESKPNATQPAGSTVPKSLTAKPSKINLDKPMPSLPPPSSRFSEHMRKMRDEDGMADDDAPPVPDLSSETKTEQMRKVGTPGQQPRPREDVLSSTVPQATKNSSDAPPQNTGHHSTKASPGGSTPPQLTSTRQGGPPKPRGLSAFPSIPQPPQYYGQGAREGSPSSGLDGQQRGPLSNARQHPPMRDGPPANPARSPYPQPIHGKRDASRERGPPRSGLFIRSESSPNVNGPSPSHSTPPFARPGHDQSRAASPAGGQHVRYKGTPSQTHSPAPADRSSPVDQRNTPTLELKNESRVGDGTAQGRTANHSKRSPSDASSKPHDAVAQLRNQDLLGRPESPANLDRAPSPTPSLRPASPGDLLSKFASAKQLPGLPNEPGPRPITPDAMSMLTPDLSSRISDPLQTLRDLTKQSEALHARHASLRADRLKLSTAISASLKDQKPSSDYGSMLLDTHLSLNAINSSMDICFAKLKSLDCKKEEAIQALVSQTRERTVYGARHRPVDSQSTQNSYSSHSSKASTPDTGFVSSFVGKPKGMHNIRTESLDSITKIEEGEPLSAGEKVTSPSEVSVVSMPESADSESADQDGLPTPKPTVNALNVITSQAQPLPTQENSPSGTARPSREQKRNTMVKMPTVSPAPSLFTKEPQEFSPVSPIDSRTSHEAAKVLDQDTDHPRRILVKGSKAAKVLGIVDHFEIPIALGDPVPAPPPKDLAIEIKIPRKPVPEAPTRDAPQPPTRQRTDDSLSSAQTETSPVSEVRTPRTSQEDLMPKGLKIGKKHPPSVHVLSDDEILEYYER